ncbi:MAG: Ig-like domain-containing protein, partial [Vallitalea sp.]|nr:Ig-like domain-containing protein [Vallitalea sp.]
MENFKKIMALLLTFIILLPSFNETYAREWDKTDVEIVESLNMLRGEGEGVTPKYLAKKTTRIQAAVMFLRLKGLEEEAICFTGEDNFSDVNDLEWTVGKNILAYLKAHPELGWVGTGTRFAPNEIISAQAYYKVMLEALGYRQGKDFEWNNTLTFAASKGLYLASHVQTFTNNDIATVTVEALKAENSSGVRLIDALIEEGIIDKDLADVLGFGPFKPEGIMTKASAIDATTLEIHFNESVDVEYEDFNIVSNSGYEYSVLDINMADSETVAIIKVPELKIGYKYTVNYGDVSKVVVPTIKEDKTKPKITFAKPITGTLLRVVIDTRNLNKDTLIADNFSLDNNASILEVNIDEEEMKKDGNENNTILLLTVKGLRSGKAYTVKSRNIDSYKGLSADYDESKDLFAGKDPDNKAPKLEGVVSEAGYKVIVYFQEDGLLDEESATDISNYRITPNIDILDAKIDKNIIGGDTTVVLNTSDQKSGIPYTIKVANISDGKNIMKDSEKDVFAGKDKPKYQIALKAEALDSTKVQVTFGYECNDTALDITQYSIDRDIEVIGAEFEEDITRVDKINRKKVILTTTELKSGIAFKVRVKTGVQDILGQDLRDSTSLMFAGKDPDLSFTKSNKAKSISRNKIQITFGEVVDRVTGTNKSNYQVSELGYPSSVLLDSTGKVATLTVQNQKSGREYKVTINNVKDRAGNKISSDTKLTFIGRGDVSDRLKIINAEALSKTKIKVDINEIIDSSGTIDLSKIRLKSETYNKSYNITDIERNNTNYIILSVGKNILTSNEVYTLTIQNGSNLRGKYTEHTFENTKECDRKIIFTGSDVSSPQFSIERIIGVDTTHIKVYLTQQLINSATAHVSEFSIFADSEYSKKAKDNNGAVIAYKEDITPIKSDNGRSVIFELKHELKPGELYYVEFNDLDNFVSETATLEPYKIGYDRARKLFVTTDDLVAADDIELDITSCEMLNKNTLKVKFNIDTKRDLTKDEVIIVNNPRHNTNPKGLSIGNVEFLDAKTAMIYFTGEEELNNSNDISYVKVIGTLTVLAGNSTSFGTDREYEIFAINSVENPKPKVAMVEPQSDTVIKITLNKRAYKDNKYHILDKNDFILYNNDTNIIIDSSQITLIPVSGVDVNKVFYIKLNDGVFLLDGNYQIGLRGNVIGVDGYVSADAYIPTSNETKNSRNFIGLKRTITKLSLTDPTNNLLIIGGTDSQDDKIEIKPDLGLAASTNYAIGFDGGTSDLSVNNMQFITSSEKSLAEVDITNQNKKGKTGQTTNVMLYDMAGNELLDDDVKITLSEDITPISDFQYTKKTNTTVVFTWTAAKEATSVKIEQKETGEENWKESETGEIGANDSTAIVTKLEKGKSYDFRLVVEGGSNAGSSNEIEVKTTNTISDFKVKDGETTNTTVVFTWTAAKEATSVKIEQKETGEENWKESETGEIGTNDSTATVTKLEKGKSYDFRLVVEGGSNAGSSN